MYYLSSLRRILCILLPLVLTWALMVSSSRSPSKNSIQIHYTLNYKDDSWEKNRTGLLWTLSYLGAELPKNSLDKSITWLDTQTFKLDLNGLGFSKEALSALGVIIDSLKQTQDYKKRKAVDLGRFMAITLGSSWHYYKITGVPQTLAELMQQHGMPDLEVFPLTTSAIAKHHRLLKVACSDTVTRSLFISAEGPGQVTDGSFSVKEFEVLDIMKNGQLRAMIYDSEGRLKAAADKAFSAAGKPAKCVWCHEIAIPNLLTKPDTIAEFMSPGTFRSKMVVQNERLNAYRSGLNGEIDFSKKQDHTFQEIVYISFMEPSLERLSQEWDMPLEALKKLMLNKPRHKHYEFTFLGDLVHRADIGDVAKYKTGRLPGSIREESDSEPDFFRTAVR